MNYFPWEKDDDEDLAFIKKVPDELKGNDWKLTEGISCSDWFPDSVTFELDPNQGIKLTDAIPNCLNIHIVSEKLKGILLDNSKHFEFFPVSIKNAKGKISKKKYYVANLTIKVNCMDMNKSKYKANLLDKSQARKISHLFLDEEKIPNDELIFRLGEMTDLLIVKEGLAKIIAIEEDCSGVIMTYLEDYGEEFRS